MEPSTSKSSKTYPATGEKPTESEMANFFDSLSKCKTKPAVLSVVPVFSENYVPKSSLVTFPKPLNTLYQSDFLQLRNKYTHIILTLMYYILFIVFLVYINYHYFQ